MSEIVKENGEKKDDEAVSEVNPEDSLSLFRFVKKNKENHRAIEAMAKEHIKKVLQENDMLGKYKIIFLMQGQEEAISSSEMDRIYSALKANQDSEPKELLLILNSMGGSVEPAYFISKCCKQLSNKFVVAVPRHAKSAATLICLGAHEIHMGIISELGPIDLQINKLPALAMEDAVDYLVSLSGKYPKSWRMIAEYLDKNLALITLGYYRRVSVSIVDYAKRLLAGKVFPEGTNADSVAKRLVKDYNDHSFVIDKEEAREIFGDCIKDLTPEYDLSNKVYQFLNQIAWYITFVTRKKMDISLVGDVNGLWIRERPDEEN